jgi:hypothetical protein
LKEIVVNEARSPYFSFLSIPFSHRVFALNLKSVNKFSDQWIKVCFVQKNGFAKLKNE